MYSPLQKEIIQLKEEKNAIILAHNYQPKEIQEIADFLGDSLELCIKAQEIEDKDIIVFCGVDFMAETAYMLNPDKKVIIPDIDAECPMAHMLTGDQVREAKEKYPDAAVCLYVNSLGEAKAESDILCTSGNVKKVVESIEEDTILFGPDTNLGEFVKPFTDKKIIPIPGDGHCYVHKLFHKEDIEDARKKYPNAEIIIHPESNKEVQEMADYVLSTGGMLSHIKNSDKKEFVVGTEVDLITRLEAEIPDKTYYPLLEGAICKTMKLHTLEKLKNCLINEEPRIIVPEDIAEKSISAVERMLEASK
ncbi:quinolinate synthase NadA [uncultured Methanobrevibacter sp.]|uniref:quinolinate synthase NadA n=1 Tax=uncultured Methanobrevibacter sp. TaxID=253161 RepID=UPI00261197ED